MSADWLVFTDLDGTLLDHDTYDAAPAVPMLQRLESAGVPVIFATSKTRAEVVVWRERLGNRHPFIVENGAAVLIPTGYFPEPPPDTHEENGCRVKAFAAPRAHWQAVLENAAADLVTGATPEALATGPAFVAFYQAGDDGVAAMTGLSAEDARRANDRQYSEPVQWRGSDAQRQALIARLEAAGAHVLQGGRFLSVSGDCDKGRALQWLQRQYEAAWARPVTTVAAGDSPNDRAMLEAAAFAVVVRSPHHSPPRLRRQANVMVSRETGPAGWAACLARLLDKEVTHG